MRREWEGGAGEPLRDSPHKASVCICKDFDCCTDRVKAGKYLVPLPFPAGFTAFHIFFCLAYINIDYKFFTSTYIDKVKKSTYTQQLTVGEREQ